MIVLQNSAVHGAGCLVRGSRFRAGSGFAVVRDSRWFRVRAGSGLALVQGAWFEGSGLVRGSWFRGRRQVRWMDDAFAIAGDRNNWGRRASTLEALYSRRSPGWQGETFRRISDRSSTSHREHVGVDPVLRPASLWQTLETGRNHQENSDRSLHTCCAAQISQRVVCPGENRHLSPLRRF